MHRGWYPLVDNQAFRRFGPPPRDAATRRPPARQPPSDREGARAPGQDVPAEDAGVDGVVGDHAAGPARRHVGAERVGARQGRDLRHASRSPRARRRRTSSRPTATYRVARTGRNGHAHRPRDRLHRLPVARPLVDGRRADSSLREVMFVDRDWRTMEGRWFTGGYDEARPRREARARRQRAARARHRSHGASRRARPAQELKIYGANLPATLRAADIDLGPGITVTRVGQRDARPRDRRRGRRGRAPRSARAICSWPARRGRRRSRSTTRSTPSR